MYKTNPTEKASFNRDVLYYCKVFDVGFRILSLISDKLILSINDGIIVFYL